MNGNNPRENKNLNPDVEKLNPQDLEDNVSGGRRFGPDFSHRKNYRRANNLPPYWGGHGHDRHWKPNYWN
ncbi:MAG: hypothetical protein LBH37_01845 [Oscillospiraceae bacterium]|jgi:hypothetical protein|nr:hypothetical protein [Oscillospiraceae bacterium]